MDINDLSNKVLFLEDLQSLYGAGSVSTPKQVILSAEDAIEDETVSEVILDETYYGDFDGLINLDYRDVVSRRIVPVYPTLETAPLSPEDSGGYVDLSLSFSGDIKKFSANGFSSDAKNRISDIDYLAIPEKCQIFLNLYAGWDSFSISLISGSRTCELIKQPESVSNGKGFYAYLFNAEYLNTHGAPFQFIVKAVKSGVETILKSCVYQCFSRRFEQFVFSGRLGGYVSFPMGGTLELAPEYEITSETFHDRIGKVSGQESLVLKMNTGGLTMKSAAVLSELLLSDYIFHRVGEEWKRIVIDSPEMSFRSSDSLQFGNFSFKYADEVHARDVII